MNVEEYKHDENGHLRCPRFAPHQILTGFTASLADITPREHVIKSWLSRRYITALLATGGVGKSIFSIVMAISIASGKDLLGVGVDERTNVLILNNEDDDDELRRRIGAVMVHHGITDEDIQGRLFFLSGYGDPHVLARRVERHAEDGSSASQIEATSRAMDIVTFCKENDIGVIFCDPLISLHEVNENSNEEMNQVVMIFRGICHQTNAALCFSHHVPKTGGDSESHAGNAHSSRGATTVTDGCRHVWTLAKMSKDTAKTLDMDEDKNRMIRADSGKENYSLSDSEATWFWLESQKIANGDWVGVPAPKNLKPDFDAAASTTGQHKKWKPTSVAEAFDRILGGKKKTKWTDIRGRFMSENDVGESRAGNLVTLISQESSEPTRITNQGGLLVDFWLTKDKRGSWFIHRQELT